MPKSVGRCPRTALAALCAVAGLALGPSQDDSGADAARAALAQAAALRDLPKLPLSFEANRGQTHEAVRFVARGAGATAWLTDSEAVLAFAADGRPAGDVLRMQFVGAAKPEVRGLREQVAKSNYLATGDTGVRGVPHFGEVAYEGLYPGVDLRWHGDRGALEYDVVVAPGADVSVVRLDMKGADGLAVADDGALAVRIGAREIVQSAPVAYQTRDGVRESVAAAFDVVGTTVGFRLGAHDASREVVIDPSIEWSTFLGGAGDETCNSVSVDVYSAVPGVVVCGGTTSIDFPLGAGHIPTAPKGGFDAYVTKLDPTGRYVVFSTYLAGRDYDEAFGVSVTSWAGAPGEIWVVGQTFSTNFPTHRPAAGGGANHGGWDAFVVNLDAAGDRLLYSTYLGGSKDDFGRGIGTTQLGNMAATGFTNSGGAAPDAFPTTPGAFQTTYGGGANDAFLTRFTQGAGALTFAVSTFLGGPGDDRGLAISVNASAVAYVAGSTSPPGNGSTPQFPHYGNGAVLDGHTVQDRYGGGLSDAFLARFDGAGSTFRWSTTYGGSGDDWAYGVASDVIHDTVAITGRTNSPDFPRVSAFQADRRGPDDAFVAKFSGDGASIGFSTYLGGRGSDQGNALVLHYTVSPTSELDAYVVGTTDSRDFPVTPGALQSGLAGGMNADAWVARLGRLTNQFGVTQDGFVKYASCFGGSGHDSGNGIAFSDFVGGIFFHPTADERLLIAGTTRSGADFPVGVGPPTFQTQRSGGSDGFVAKLHESNPPTFPAGEVVALARTADSIAVAWKSPVEEATDLSVRRVAADGAQTQIAVVAPTATQFIDTGLAPDTSYAYSVVAVTADGTELASNTASAATLPYPPAAPSGLSVVADGSRVALAWTDASTNETGFEVQRATDGAFATVATTKTGATRHETTQIASAAIDAVWRVVAVNRGGSSSPSNEVSATTTPTLSLKVLAGSLVDGGGPGADRFAANGAIVGASSFDPNTQALRIELGRSDGPLVLVVPAGDRGWTEKRGVATFDSARSFLGGARFKLVLDARRGLFSLKASGFDFPSLASPVSLGVALGEKAGASSAEWTATGRGRMRLR